MGVHMGCRKTLAHGGRPSNTGSRCRSEDTQSLRALFPWATSLDAEIFLLGRASGEACPAHNPDVCSGEHIDLALATSNRIFPTTRSASLQPSRCVRQASFHRGRHPESLVNAGEIVPCHIKVNGGFEMREFLGKSVCKAREAPQVHSDAEVLAFDMAGANMGKIRVAADWGWDRLEQAYLASKWRYTTVQGFPEACGEWRKKSLQAARRTILSLLQIQTCRHQESD